MKKSIILAVVAVAVTAVSCRKERTCECTSTTTTAFSGGSTSSSSTWSRTGDKQKKGTFKYTTNCFSYTSTQTFTSGTTVTEDQKCELK